VTILGQAELIGKSAEKGGEWRIANGEWFFLEGSATALPKFFGA